MQRSQYGVLLILILLLTACSPNPTEPAAPLAPASQVILELCSPEDIQVRVAELNEDLQAASLPNTDEALQQLESIQLQISALYNQCNVLKLTDDDSAAIELLENLWDGGLILYMRHTHTDRSRGDTDLSHCDGQRILSEQGREEALMVRPFFAQLQIPVDRLYSTEYCRVRETAVLAFGTPDIIPRAELLDMMPVIMTTPPVEGKNIIIVAHIGTLERSLGLPDTFEEGDTLVYEPDGDGGHQYIGRIALSDWAYLARVAQALRLAEQ
ncbi:MAG: hypothetical protein DWQ07_22835 [Chloroflexi bacterium]|nr:MAG: hypothetical protein DWQ07_22835 [Chloroflexota bacterium]MBL1193985.1 hypothetical protein [Chloroflexota bacterium]NOH11279.1 hypothetical protein [Chloroflexota bacterium]